MMEQRNQMLRELRLNKKETLGVVSIVCAKFSRLIWLLYYDDDSVRSVLTFALRKNVQCAESLGNKERTNEQTNKWMEPTQQHQE